MGFGDFGVGEEEEERGERGYLYCGNALILENDDVCFKTSNSFSTKMQ